MTLAHHDRPAAQPHARYLFLWLLVQIGALALAAGRVSLSARFFQPAERVAVVEMLIIQLTVASLTFPLLLNHWRSAFAVMLTAIPMLTLANVLARHPLTHLLVLVGYLEFWLLTLAVWAQHVRALRSQLTGVSIATTVTLFSAILWYLSAEFQPEAPLPAILAPVAGAGLISHRIGSVWTFMAVSAIFLAGGIGVSITHRLRRRR